MSERNILLVVEGMRAEKDLFKRILQCFPEIDLSPENIFVYDTNIWVLNHKLNLEFGDKWYEQDIDFLGYIKSLQQDLKGKKFTDIYLVFDYERQDDSFCPDVIEHMLQFFNNSTDNGQLYINYPMIESYRHLSSPLPDFDFLNRQCTCAALISRKYKEIVGIESDFKQLRRIQAEDFREFVIHNLCKASHIIFGTSDISEKTANDYWAKLDMLDILKEQNKHSTDKQNGFIYVLCTCLFFIPEYNSNLIFN